MNSYPLVSIALCTYNGAVHLEEQLDSIVNQTYPNLEVVLVDDGSKDNTHEILKSYAAKYHNFKIYQNEFNLGYIKNFEKAISLCSGEFIALCDQDDVWLENKIALQVSEIGDNILVYHDSAFIDDKGASLDRKISDVRRFYAGNDSRYFLFENCVSGHTVLFHKKLIPYLDNFTGLVMHDWWLAYVATNIGSIAFSSLCLVRYRQHSNMSTDILRQKKKIREGRKISFAKFIERIRIFSNYPYNKHQKFTFHLLKLLEAGGSENQPNINLFLFILKHKEILLFMQRKGFWSKMNFIRKFL
ncbi:glycosyltransferase family 2 protein [Pedobacter rhodius]|uniref:Glycosyltransferase family 2 protein n=1 Tax=Pedobacter rhodius TaxID=3004098 RepID=A0ABT4KXU8_9SPHI|nr:glycosyltransferase family 2 protein [Pedobacter sp. SJ11]MCZ4223758.1 glycosyltransferase family 2 protein [Pedobacter sp. SJ11]